MVGSGLSALFLHRILHALQRLTEESASLGSSDTSNQEEKTFEFISQQTQLPLKKERNIQPKWFPLDPCFAKRDSFLDKKKTTKKTNFLAIFFSVSEICFHETYFHLHPLQKIGVIPTDCHTRSFRALTGNTGPSTEISAAAWRAGLGYRPPILFQLRHLNSQQCAGELWNKRIQFLSVSASKRFGLPTVRSVSSGCGWHFRLLMTQWIEVRPSHSGF